MSKIILDGDPLQSLPLETIVRRAAYPTHQVFQGGNYMDFYRNRDVLKLFSGLNEIDIPMALERYDDIAPGLYSKEFEALRCGELLNWSFQHGIVVRVRGRDLWNLVHREQVFELCGPERKQLAVRVRGLSGPQAVNGAKIWQRELKRRERARVRRVKKLLETLEPELKFIVRHAPDTKLRTELARFVVGDIDSFGECHQLVHDGFLSLELGDAYSVARAVTLVYRETVKLEFHMRHADELAGLEL